jgi:hypothetical protein
MRNLLHEMGHMHVRNGDRYAGWVYPAATARDDGGQASIARGLEEVKSLMYTRPQSNVRYPSQVKSPSARAG